MQKYAKKFAYIKNLLYLCTEIKKQPNQRWRQHHKNGNKIMFKISWTNYKGETGIINATVFNTIEAAKKRIKQLNAMRGNWQIVKYSVVAA